MATGGHLLEKALDAAGGKSELDRKFRQYQGSVSFIDENREELLKRYDGNWVAVYNSRVVAHAKRFQELMQKLSSSDLPTNEILIEFISSRKVLTLYYI